MHLSFYIKIIHILGSMDYFNMIRGMVGKLNPDINSPIFSKEKDPLRRLSMNDVVLER